MSSWRCFGVVSVLAALGTSSSIAQDQGKNDKSTQTADQNVSDVDIKALIVDLDANRFSQRQAASQKLRQLRTAAFPALIEAASGDSREAATRALEILKEHFTKGGGEIKEEAKKALEKLSTAKKPTIARLAKEILEPDPPQRQPAFRMAPIGGGQIQIQFQAGGAAGGRQVQVKTVNGVKQIDVTDKGKKIKIVDDPNNGIEVEITEKVDGKDKTRKFKAKDAAELKKKHPEAHKVFEQYKQGGGIQIQFGQQGAIPLQINAPRFKPGVQPFKPEISKQLEKISSQLEETGKLLKDLPTQDKEQLAKAIEQLEKAKQGLEDTRSKIGN